MKIELKNVKEVAFLRLNGFIVLGSRVVRESRRGTLYFVLEGELQPAQVTELRRSFRNGRSLVEPKAYGQSLQDTKDFLFEELRKEKGY